MVTIPFPTCIVEYYTTQSQIQFNDRKSRDPLVNNWTVRQEVMGDCGCIIRQGNRKDDQICSTLRSL